MDLLRGPLERGSREGALLVISAVAIYLLVSIASYHPGDPGWSNAIHVDRIANIDDLEGYAFINANSPIRIAAGEWQNTHWEFLDLAHRGKLDVLQPDVGRVGGFTEARKVTQLASDYGRLVVPHCWKTGIGIAASAHLGFAASCCPFIEFLPAHLSESVLRDELVADELQMVDGEIPLPQKAGLGIELNRDALQRYLVD